MDWLLLTVLSVFSRATFGVATKVLSKRVKVSAVSQAVMLLVTGGLLAIPLSPFIGGISFYNLSDVWLLALVMIISSAIGNVLFFKGLEKLDASSAQVIFSSILLWSIFLSILFLGSQFSLYQLVGIAVLLFAIILIQYKKDTKLMNKNVWYMLIAALLFAIFQVSSAELAKTISVGAYTLLAYLGGAFVLWAIYPKKISKEISSLAKQYKRAGVSTLFAASTSLLYAVFAYLAYASAPDRGVVVLLLTSQVILGVILAIIFLKERDQIPKKIAAGALAVIAGLLIKS